MNNEILSVAPAQIKEQIVEAIKQNNVKEIWVGSTSADENIKDCPNISFNVTKFGTFSVTLTYDLTDEEKVFFKQEFRSAKLRDVDSRIENLQNEREEIINELDKE